MGGAAPHVCSQRPALGQAYGVVTFGAGVLGLTPPGDRAAARISLFARRLAYGYPSPPSRGQLDTPGTTLVASA